MKVFVLLVCLALCLIAAGCSGQTEDSGTKADPEGSESEVTSGSAGDYTLNTKVTDVGDILVWYNNVNPDRTVEITNYLKDQAASGEQIFYDIYTDEEKSEDPEKEDTGLFFFRGDPGAQTACEDLARAIAFLHENAEELQIDISDVRRLSGGCISGSWGSDHAVYRAVRGDRKRASHLRLCGNQGWDRFIPVHGKLYQPDTGRWNGCPDRGV